MKRTLLFTLLMMFAVTAAAQKRYDEIKYPKLNEFKKANVEEFQLDNGIKFYLVEDKELPLIRITATIRTGSLQDPSGKEGLASITGELIREGGSENYPADELNVLLEDKAAFMSTFIGQGSGSASMNILKEDFDELLPVFVDLVSNPLFPEDKIELSKTQRKSGISRRNDDQGSIANREYSKLIYGENSPLTRQIEYATLDAISREDIVAFHKEAFVGNNMTFGVIGDFDTKEMKRKLEKAFGSLPAGTENNLIYPEVNYSFPSTVNFINKSDVNQSYVLVGHIGGLRENPDYAKLQMMNQILGGGFAGRLFQTVRTDLGLAYAVGGGYGSNINYPGTFSLFVMTKSSTTAEAIDALIVEVEKMQTNPVTKKELDDARDRFLNSLVFRYDSKQKILNERISNEYNGLSKDAFDKYVEELKKVTVSDIQDVAKEYLNPDKVQILVVGNAEEVGDQLQKYGNVNEIDITIPTPKSDKAEVTGDAAKGKEWLGKMADAVIEPGTNLETITTVSTIDQATPSGTMSIKNTASISYTDYSIDATLETPQGSMKMMVENGAGKMIMMGQEQALPFAMTKPMVDDVKNSYINVALNADKLNAEYLGMEQMNGENFIVLKVQSASTITFLLDPTTALPAFSKVSSFNPQMGKEVETITSYSDWKVTNGVAYAFAQETKTDGQVSSSSEVESIEVN
ncbi:MAG: insulinase family protein [Balneola sp.]|nr:insulinase family protein [Balneola sp.]MBO6649922.1 insulinase family protein [Balneola sp.]MBO6711730.1 insulinase family protein [Balneola sp.]MBO6799924.1 insulinase family protein [Balneola sp.]MBO6871169.1 insulinase family protein [Balneola sp.]